MTKFRFLSFVAAAVFALPALADAKTPLEAEAHINEQLIAGAAGDILRHTCPSISARMFVVWGKLTDLENYARAKGYTEAEVNVFLRDKAQKARIKAAAEAYLTGAGAVAGDVESYCAAGRQEIARKTLLGSLLRSSE